MKHLIWTFFFFGLLACKPSAPKKDSEQLKAMYVDLKGATVSLSDYKGKKILVNYWATWCGPCKKEMPALLKAQEILKESNYVFLLVSEESIAKILNFKSTTKYNFNFLKMNGSMEALGIYALPTTFIYNEEGKKVKEIVGAVHWDSEEMIQTLKEI